MLQPNAQLTRIAWWARWKGILKGAHADEDAQRKEKRGGQSADQCSVLFFSSPSALVYARAGNSSNIQRFFFVTATNHRLAH